jgi:DNA-directed RNA polymerase subunit F
MGKREMISEASKIVAEKAKKIYASRLKSQLEATHMNKFVAIEPESGEHFIADSFSQAVADARKAYPDRLSFVVRVGHHTAIHIGGMAN